MSRILGSAAVRDSTFEEALDLKTICVLIVYFTTGGCPCFIYVADVDELKVNGKPI
jgi:hypothetical protein